MSILVLGWIDIFNPVAIAMLLLLLSMVRKRWHVMIFIIGSYVAYVLAAIAIYFGVDRFLLKFWSDFTRQTPSIAGTVLLVLGAAAFIGFVLMIVSIIRAISQKREMTFEKVFFIKSVAPWFIFLLSFGSTWSCMFSAYAMLAFIGILITNGISIGSAIWLIALFGLFSLIPTVTIYLLDARMDGQRFKKVMGVVSKIMNGFCLYSTPVVLAIVAWLSLAAGIRWLGGQ